MFKIAPMALLVALLAGCVANQGRDNDARDLYVDDDSAREVYLHGHSGLEAARIFNTGAVGEARGYTAGASLGMQVNEFYLVEIAQDPLRPTALTPVGYVRKLKEERGETMIFQFFDSRWNAIAYLGADGSLYRHDRGSESYLGRFQLDDAVRTLFAAPGGYGMDTEAQDLAIVNMHDPDVNSAPARVRGVHLRTHRSYPAIVAYTLKRAGEVGQMANLKRSERVDAENEMELAALRAARWGGHGDGNYGGLRFKDGNPVDDNDVPLRPGSATRD